MAIIPVGIGKTGDEIPGSFAEGDGEISELNNISYRSEKWKYMLTRSGIAGRP